MLLGLRPSIGTRCSILFDQRIMGSLRILIADDHEVVRRGLRSLLGSRPDWEICGEATDGQDAVQKARSLKPDLIMLDISMPYLNGLDAARIIRKENPESEILILSQHESSEVVRAALDAGARGYVAKADISRDLLSAVEAVSQHRSTLSANINNLHGANGDRTRNVSAIPIAAMDNGAPAAALGQVSGRVPGQVLSQPSGELPQEDEFLSGRGKMTARMERTLLQEALKSAQNELEIRVQQRTAELAKATEALKEQAQLLNLAHDAIIVRDLDSAITFWNQGAEQTYGWSTEEALGKITHTFLATQFPEPLETVQRRLFETGAWEGELVHLCKDGSRITVESRWALQYDKQNKPARILEINRDLTRRKRAEERLAEQAQLLDLANDAIFVRTLDHKLTYWNQGAERLYGWKKGEVLGRPVPDVLHTEFPIPFSEITAQLMKYGTWEGDLIHAKRDGSRIQVESRWTLWTGRNGEPLGYLEINSDITERKVAEQNLRTLTARLLQLQDEERRRIARELHDSAGQLLVALDLNLASIQRESKKLGSAAARCIAESKGLIQELSKELRTISHLLHPPLLDESGLQSAVRWYVEGFAERSKIPVKLEVAPDLGRLPRDLETAVFRMVQECLTNIHRHSESPTAEIRIARDAGHVTVEVRDEGKGMALEVHRNSVNPITPGVGLQGMRERIRQLGGQLEIESAKGRGTVVHAILPIGNSYSHSAGGTLGAAS